MKWRYFAERELPRVIRDLGIPCARESHATGMTRCPRHDEPLGKTTRMCLACHNQAWEEVARRYREQGQPVNRQPEPQPEKEERQMTISSTEFVDHVPGTELETVPAAPITTLFGTSDPKLALERMAEMASLLVDVVRERKLIKRISGNEYLLAPGWAVLAGMTGLTPYTAWTRPLEDGTGYIARVEVRRIVDGAVVSAAEQVCSRSESKWARAEDHALLGMAQTRASSRALRGPLMQVVELAGYKPTPFEEMPDVVVDQKPEGDNTRRGDKIPDPHKPTDDQVAELRRLLDELEAIDPGTDWTARARELAGVSGDLLTRTTMEQLLYKLGQELEEAPA